MSQKRIEAFEVIDHGIEHSQYFQGCGVSHTRYTDVATGIGDTPSEALDDALEQLASAGYDVSRITSEIDEAPATRLEWFGTDYDARNAHSDCEPDLHGTCSVCADNEEAGSPCRERDWPCAPEGWHDDCELYYFVSVRVRASEGSVS